MIRLLAEIQRKNQVSMSGISDDLEDEQNMQSGQNLEENQNVEGRQNLERGQSVKVDKEGHISKPNMRRTYCSYYIQ